MAGESAFDKLHVEEKDKANLVGVLEELNLPASVVEFVRKNQKLIYGLVAILIVGVVAWALYGSYHEKKINESSSALALAKQEIDIEKINALQKVTEEFSGSQAAMWATIEEAHEEMKKGQYATATDKYVSIRKGIKKNNPLFPLLTLGIAQAKEQNNQNQEAFIEYETLKGVVGYENIGYTGMARLYEILGEPEKSLAVYEEYLSTFSGENQNSPDRDFVQEKVSNLKARL